MESLIISFCDHYIRFCTMNAHANVKPPDGYIVFDDTDLDRCFDTLTQNHDVWVWCRKSMHHIVSHLHRRYTFVKAAGGLVSAPDGRRLLIRREGRWDVPKGMVEPGETLAQAALREVGEETGITQLVIQSLILKTYHIYDKYGGWHLKQTSWYAMTSPNIESTIPQVEEGITQAVWLPETECVEHLNHSFASLKLLCQSLTQQTSESL